MNRATTRAEYMLDRLGKRLSAGQRTDRGLPHHPDGSGFAVCPRCFGTGVIDHGHWHPELWTSSICTLCDGSGFIDDGYRDPLLRLREARKRSLYRRDPEAYRWLRLFCFASRHPLLLNEAVVDCGIALRGAVAAWREVA